MEEGSVRSAEGGTCMLSCGVPIWPSPTPAIIRECAVSDGRILIWAMPTGQLLAELVFEHDEYVHPSFKAVSLPLRVTLGDTMVIIVTWRSGKVLGIYVNGKAAFILDGAEPVADYIEVANGPIIGAPHDFSEANEKARKDRANAIRGAHPHPKRKHGGEQYALGALKDEADQLRDLVRDVEAGKEYHVPGMAARVRLLVYGKPMGLLQACAGYRQAPLILYTMANPFAEIPAVIKECAISLNFEGRAASQLPYINPVDLDVWLHLMTLTLSGREYTNLEVIKEVGDTIGAHRDIGITSAIAALMSRPSLSGSKYNDVTNFTLELARIVLGLSDGVLGHDAGNADAIVSR